jgi:hypothetical protein
MKWLISFIAYLISDICFSEKIFAQPVKEEARVRCIFFPSPMYDLSWQHSLGFITTTTPEDIAEEMRVRIPAIDYHVLRKISSGFNFDGRILFQLVQNHISGGIKYSRPLNNILYFSLGDDMAYWFGNLKGENFDTKGYGWINYPNASIGIRTDREIVITVKAEAVLNISNFFSVGGVEVEQETNFFNGFSGTLALEQPFFGRTHVTLGFTAKYVNFFWQTWSLYETFDRNIFYPQITVGFIL